MKRVLSVAAVVLTLSALPVNAAPYKPREPREPQRIVRIIQKVLAVIGLSETVVPPKP